MYKDPQKREITLPGVISVGQLLVKCAVIMYVLIRPFTLPTN